MVTAYDFQNKHYLVHITPGMPEKNATKTQELA